MNYFLNIETSTTVCSVAIHREGILVADAESHIPQAHHRIIFRLLKEVLATASIGIEEVAAVGISIGPGSYTGLRIGLSVAKGIAYGRNVPIISINTLELMLQNALGYIKGEKGYLCALMDAGRGYAYRMVTDGKGCKITDTEACKVVIDSFTPWLGSCKPFYIIGNGADRYREALGVSSEIKLIEGIYPKAADMGKLVYEKFCQKKWEDIAYIEPIYFNAFAQKGKEDAVAIKKS